MFLLGRVACLTLLLAAVACRCPATAAGEPGGELAAIRATLDELYAAFSFDPGSEPDWETQRRIYLAGAAFVPPIRADRVPRAGGTERFLADFREFASSEEFQSSGFHERILAARIDVFGGIAHAFVAFEGFFPADSETQSRGLDSLQLVNDGGLWRLVSFTTQYESEGLTLPARFLHPPASLARP